MRVTVAIDKYLLQMQVERDWTPRSLHSYQRDLAKIVDDHGPELRLHDCEGRAGTDLIRSTLGRHWGQTSATTRARVISELHSFFDWAEGEDLIESNPATRIKRPPKRKPKVYRPSEAELLLGRHATTLAERPAWLLMEGAGCRVSDIVTLRWRQVDLTRGRVQLFRKGHNWQWVPLAADVLAELQDCYRQLAPDPGDHVFVAETEQWVSAERRVRRLLDPSTPRTTKTVWRMVGRVCRRAGLPAFHPHQLRHGFASRFVRQSRLALGAADIQTLQFLLGHSRIDTTQRYVDELEVEEAAEVLRRIAQASPDQATAEPPEWRVRAGLVMEAAGLEPASAASPVDGAAVTEPEEPPRPPDSPPEGCH